MSTILLVDDSSTVLMSMSQMLQRFGYQVATAISAEDAFKKVQGGLSFNLMITDFNMPGKNGADLIRALRGSPKHRFTPMLVLTTESQRERRDEAKSAGATGWLVKPADPVQLQGALKKLLPNG
ncbi:response regulator [Tropicibacter alexandrii]|uniref:response regulator n=1 Tax=Tropicibacter alexandrii TaxID=2267683 RepID=UPI000EF499C2|nr:response regulator [Tropicibacter alexandrii]